MKNLLVTLMIAFVLFTSSPAEAGRASVIKKILDKVVDLLKGKPTVKKKSGDEGGNIYNLGEEGAGIIYDLDEDGARKRLESNRDEEKNGREGPRRFTLKEINEVPHSPNCLPASNPCPRQILRRLRRSRLHSKL